MIFIERRISLALLIASLLLLLILVLPFIRKKRQEAFGA
jgi:TctA family transporter